MSEVFLKTDTKMHALYDLHYVFTLKLSTTFRTLERCGGTMKFLTVEINYLKYGDSGIRKMILTK